MSMLMGTFLMQLLLGRVRSPEQPVSYTPSPSRPGDRHWVLDRVNATGAHVHFMGRSSPPHAACGYCHQHPWGKIMARALPLAIIVLAVVAGCTSPPSGARNPGVGPSPEPARTLIVAYGAEIDNLSSKL